MCNLYPLLKLNANSAFRGKYCHQKSAKLNIGQPCWINLANKGMAKKGLHSYGKVKAQNKHYQSRKNHDMTIVTKIRSIGPTNEPAKWEIPIKNNKARRKKITVNRLGQTKCVLAK